jgi:hypothetical protein
LVTERCGPSGVCSTGFGGSLSRLTLIASAAYFFHEALHVAGQEISILAMLEA